LASTCKDVNGQNSGKFVGQSKLPECAIVDVDERLWALCPGCGAELALPEVPLPQALDRARGHVSPWRQGDATLDAASNGGE
jgi:hypothetical protein